MEMLRTTFLHSDWEFIQTDTEGKKIGYSFAEWLPAQVPGSVHLDLITNGIIADPFERMNEMGVQWVDGKDWSYRTQFDYEPDKSLPKQVLRFEGLDTICTILLNGEVIGSSDNMFVPLELDVTGKLEVGINDLRIDFKSAVNEGLKLREAYFEANSLKDPIERFEERTFVRKAQYMYGWDWGPRLVSAGVWQPVSLIQYASRITEVYVRQEHHEDGSVALHIQSEIEGSGELTHTLEPFGTLTGDGTLVIPNAPKWSPENPVLFHLVSQLGSDDALVQNIGFSHVRLLQEKDQFGESFEFEVNGRKVWIRGANWIPDHSFPAAVSTERYRDRLTKAKDMGFNMLRVWAGGLYETEAFYDLCDELGILVWQDFPFGCAYYPDDEPWQAIIRNEAMVNIKRIRNRVSLALWCGNNENHEMFFNKWGDPAAQPPRYFGVNHYEDVLPKVVAEFDPGRSYIVSSPIGSPPADDTDNEKLRGPNSNGYGDQHNWDAWHGRGDWRYYSDSEGRFSSEYGFASSCNTELWEKTLGEGDWDHGSPAVRWHDKTGKGYETFQGFVKLHYPESDSLEDWVYYSQLNQRDALRFGVEHYRRSEFCKGSLIWQLNDCWPVQSWAILDGDGNYKALAYELRRLYADATSSLFRKNDEFTLWAINDGAETVSGVAQISVFHLRTGDLLRSYEEVVSVEPGARQPAVTGSIKGLAVPDLLVVGTWAGDETWQLATEPKLARFPDPSDLVVSTHSEGVLRIQTSAPVVDLMLLDEGSVSTLLDNYVTMQTPGIFEVRVTRTPVELTARSLSGDHRVKLTPSPI